MILSKIRQLHRTDGWTKPYPKPYPPIICTSPVGGVFTIREHRIDGDRFWIKFTLGLFRREPRWIEVDPDDFKLLPIGTHFFSVGSRSAQADRA